MSFSTPWEKRYFSYTWPRMSNTQQSSHVNFFFRKGAADTLVNAYLSIYFAYTPFYGSLTLYE